MSDDKKLEIHSIWDNGGETFDRYTVYYNEKERSGYHTGRGMSEHPCAPNGVGCCTTGRPGKHTGKKVHFYDLPKDCRELIDRDLDRLSLNDTAGDTRTYWRNPTMSEIKFGYGATHYRDFTHKEASHPDGRPKKWLKADDGLRYNRG